MTELTRDEIRRACIAVGWDQVKSLGLTFSPNAALALLQATGEDFQINYFKGEHGNNWWKVEISPIDAYGEGPGLPEAAVRAVVAWARARS